ncbi:hypothetical protein ACWDDN_43940 [Streptomyces griseoruber]|uniref:hypothetical protein n=1 Tax=Streptomyces griseoruber TaxID=1943 RepID=UPI000A5BD87B|nr:hypothetical protein [Streptomyces griseoruber]
MCDAGLAEALEEIRESVPGNPAGPDGDFFEPGGNPLFAVRAGAAPRARGPAAVPLRALPGTPGIRASTGGRRSLATRRQGRPGPQSR